ncbi:MAG: hypothetical protein ABEJ70_05910 [Halobacteriaceae archaeon]
MRSTDDTSDGGTDTIPDGGTGTEFDWVTVEERDRQRVPWRALWVLAVMLVAGLLASTLVLSGGANAQISATFSASDVSVTGHAGKLSSLTVGPNVSVSYTGLESPGNDVEMRVYVKNSSSSSYTQIASKTVTSSGYAGTVSHNFSQTSVLNAANLDATDFRATEGQSTSVDVDVKANATIVGAGPGGSDVNTSTQTRTFTVTVHNKPISTGVGGSANTNAAAKAPA